MTMISSLPAGQAGRLRLFRSAAGFDFTWNMSSKPTKEPTSIFWWDAAARTWRATRIEPSFFELNLKPRLTQPLRVLIRAVEVVGCFVEFVFSLARSGCSFREQLSDFVFAHRLEA